MDLSSPIDGVRPPPRYQSGSCEAIHTMDEI